MEYQTRPDFTGQHIYVGIDVSKTSWKTTILTAEVEHKTFTQPPESVPLVNYLHRHFPGATYHCVYEAGYCGFWIYEQLCRADIDCMVANPADVPSTQKDLAYKTDRRDARKLARALRNGDMEALYVPSRVAQEDRSLVRLRHTLVIKQTRCRNQIKALMSYYGLALPEELSKAHWSKRMMDALDHLCFASASGNATLKTLLEEARFLRQHIAQATTQIRTRSQEEPYSERVQYLVTIPGVSILTAMTLLTEIVDMERFATLDHLASYVGLVPGEHSSGDTHIVTGLSHRCNASLRNVLIESAWVAVRKDPALLRAFQQLSKRMAKNQTIIRIARKLLNRIRFVLVHRQPYRSGVMHT